MDSADSTYDVVLVGTSLALSIAAASVAIADGPVNSSDRFIR